MDYSDKASAQAAEQRGGAGSTTSGNPTSPTQHIQNIQDIQDVSDRGKPSARPTGPNASAIIAGLVALFLAGLVIARETMNLRVDWSRLGPGTIIGLGLVMVLIGAVGLVRRRHHGA